MAQITKPPVRDIIEDFAKEIAGKKQRGPKPQTHVIAFRDDEHYKRERDVFLVPIELLRYRKDNGRICSDVLNFEKNNYLLSETDENDQKIIRSFLEEKDKEKTEELKKSIQHSGQREPAIITCDGFLINGNRRKMVLEKLMDELIELTPYAREELRNVRHHENDASQLERARRFLISSMMAINGVFGEERGGFSYSNSYSRSGKEARVSRWYNLPERLTKIVERLRSVRIENKDARKLIKDFLDRPATLLYLDPPYLGKRTQGYDFDQNDERFHEELLGLACGAQCMVMISGYDNELYNSMLKPKLGWERIEIATHTQGSNGKRFTRTEILWLNKACIDARNCGRVPINLTEKEKKMGKINPVRR